MNLTKISHDKLISTWLLISIILIYFMIIVGGLTRLTNSGLSITEWELFKGIFPPFTQETWLNYFELYKQIPQFEFVNPLMSLNEFKVIFYWENFHRLLGRVIGLFFLIPLVYFTYKKVLDKKSIYILYFIFLMILLQGVIGWYMVESGLIQNLSVSHYRLSLHLILAFIIISFLFWNYLNSKYDSRKIFFNSKNKLIKTLLVLTLFQIILGAFVSGLDAGLIYQTWPKMNLAYFPDDINFDVLNTFNLLNEQSFVQFLHRTMAYLIMILVLYIGISFYYNKKIVFFKSYFIVLFSLIIQGILGIYTLLSGLNILLASLHQITSVILVFSVLNLNHKMS